MRMWRSLSGIVLLGSAVACATATNSGDSGGSDFSAGDATVAAFGGTASGGAGDSATGGSPAAAGGETNGGGPLAFGGTASMSGGASTGDNSGGALGTAGTSSGASAGASFGSSGATSGGASGGPSSGPCMDPKDVKGGNSGALGVADVCLRTTEKFNTVGCSSFDGRTLKVNGLAVTCGSGAAYTPIDGYNYFEISAGGATYASINWFCTLQSCG